MLNKKYKMRSISSTNNPQLIADTKGKGRSEAAGSLLRNWPGYPRGWFSEGLALAVSRHRHTLPLRDRAHPLKNVILIAFLERQVLECWGILE